MDAHACNLRKVHFAIGKVALASCLLLMQLFPNHTRIHVITNTIQLLPLFITRSGAAEGRGA